MVSRGRKRPPLFYGALLDNPILVQAVGLTPALIATRSVRVALWISLLTAAHLIICEAMASQWLKRWEGWARNAVYFGVGILMMLAAGLLFERSGVIEVETLRYMLPLMAANAVVALRCERFAVQNTLRNSLRDAIANAAGFAVMLTLVAALREFLGFGTLLGLNVSQVLEIQGFRLPFGALLLLGFMAAVLKSVIHNMRVRGRVSAEAEEAMEMVPEDRIERLEKIHKLLQEAEVVQIEAERMPQDQPQEPAAPEIGLAEALNKKQSGKYSPEEKARLDQALEDLLKDFDVGGGA